MGAPMAKNLHRAGLLQSVWNRTRVKAAELAAELGCQAPPSLAEFAPGLDAVVICVSADADVRSIVESLAPALPHPIPVPIAAGAPSARYPWTWSVRRWIEGSPAATTTITDPVMFAEQLAGFLRALRDVDPTDGPPLEPVR